MGQVFFNESFLFIAHFRRFLNFFLVFSACWAGFPPFKLNKAGAVSALFLILLF